MPLGPSQYPCTPSGSLSAHAGGTGRLAGGICPDARPSQRAGFPLCSFPDLRAPSVCSQLAWELASPLGLFLAQTQATDRTSPAPVSLPQSSKVYFHFKRSENHSFLSLCHIEAIFPTVKAWLLECSKGHRNTGRTTCRLPHVLGLGFVSPPWPGPFLRGRSLPASCHTHST